MGHISYLSKRGSVYYARIDVPEDLVSVPANIASGRNWLKANQTG